MSDDLTSMERSLLVVGLVGVSGAGNSSLSPALTRSNGRFVEGKPRSAKTRTYPVLLYECHFPVAKSPAPVAEW